MTPLPIVDPGPPVLYDVEHVTSYRYALPVTVSHQCAHLKPRSFATQQVLSTQLGATPLPEIRSERIDYFGNTVTSFSLSEPHESLTVVAQSQVRILPPTLPAAADTPRWEEVAERLRLGFGADTLDACQMLYPSGHVKTLPEVRAYALPSFPPDRPILEAAIDLTGRIHADFTYDPTATTVATPLAEVLAKRRGVCQDFAHLQIACLRSMGLAARYVSGYVLTCSTESGERLEGGDASHAWVSLYVPCAAAPNGGWIDLDPTNDKLITREHVTVAWGRDFEDVSPIKGVMLGGGAQTVSVAVTLRPRTNGPRARTESPA
ncbi:transglutaminase family protein [Rhodospirillum rubrum]|uniref:Transglutaminase-like n=1 Tax=Rhodospirillum rubrum (strain ATCC 11170 / ATH 1.1.1 / DSM 467 / LMG 4362 / NCIMB 8255 / S1) TaxID=269796 RepID=Q2RR85_RHORT|nr:transglutaminase family protein [Rhodospirillum rubrum]ABC23360.1 Transglutaminase-like [Rhodospirillum rubrum ATCC 11170]AEO49093.1 transglutaminase-like protein [Rhodospirillum rubrum F11]MBK5955004.1 transglutaminase [Rhodospirillum rubrum]QXG79333.1 transglutaminase family protein [Rhodospirillum rubrum]HAP99184.1 transglutaminase family protein [Rhodospirillum rubrum]